MKVVCAGLSKTGTSSLHKGLRQLGYSSLHHDTERLNPILDGKIAHPDFRIYDDIDAVLDLPAAWFYEELLAAYPESKCILTVRNEDSWWESIQTHFNQRHPVRCQKDDPFRGRLRHLVYGSATAIEWLYRRKYREHNERVQAIVPPHRLLVMDITDGDGWAQLCPFLGNPLPDQPFPRENSRVEYQAWQQRLNAVRSQMAKALPRNARSLFLDEERLRTALGLHPGPTPFPEREGVYWGPPEDDAAALCELARARKQGFTYLVIAWPAFWWLEHYPALANYLRQNCLCLHQSADLQIYALKAKPAQKENTA